MSAASRKLSPRSKRLMLGATHDVVVEALVQINPALDRDRFAAAIAAAGAQLVDWSPEAAVATIRVAASALPAVAEIRGITYIEVGEPYRSSERQRH